jgi:sugar phosphate isomerase/epimerase
MYKTLSPSAIEVKVEDLSEALAAARMGGFEGLEVSPGRIADLVEQEGSDRVRRRFADAGIIPAAFGLPVEWRQDEPTWQRGLDALPRLARSAAAIGIRRCFTWIMPCSNERDFDANCEFHIARFKPIAEILAEHDIALGLEFIGPKTLRDSQKYPFIYRMGEMLELGEKIGPNVGLLLDCWHWYTSGGTIDELLKLRPEQVVYVHVNDAPRGIAIDQQIDNVRDLPGATGVIDIRGFLQALKSIGYDGPVTPEPFKKELAALPSDEARLKRVGAAMDEIFKKAGLQS